jgi:hypothetical protein
MPWNALLIIRSKLRIAYVCILNAGSRLILARMLFPQTVLFLSWKHCDLLSSHVKPFLLSFDGSGRSLLEGTDYLRPFEQDGGAGAVFVVDDFAAATVIAEGMRS